MDQRALLDAFLKAQTLKDFESALEEFKSEHGESIKEIPVGNRPNNRGAIEVAADAGRSLIERVTNAQDALLELEHQLHGGVPECKSPREAAEAWLGVPSTKGLSGLSNAERQQLAKRIVVRLDEGEGWQSRVVSVFDDGIGIAPDDLAKTILSLNESNKISKHYLAGTYGQGGSSTYAFSKYAFICSRSLNSDEIAFTVVRYLDLPAEDFKTGQYVYLVQNDKPLIAQATTTDALRGTTIRHFGFDLSTYTQSIGPKSVYGVLQRVMFDPVSPVRFENNVHKWNRVIKGVRNALNGAVDQGDEGKGPELDHSVPMFYISLGEFGQIGIEYWLLKRSVDDKGVARKNQSDSFVDSHKPIILSHNGQNQGELSSLLLRKNADLPYLRSRLIAQINCDRLTPHAKRILFSSTREQSREGFLLDKIKAELVEVLRADDELTRLNEEARSHSLKEKDETVKQQMRKQVARLLQIHGKAKEPVGGTGNTGGPGKPSSKSGPRKKPEPIDPKDPPTFIRILWDSDKDIQLYQGQRKYLRVETDADSSYHTPDKPDASRINVVVGGDLQVFGTSPLAGGRMRIGVECKSPVATGSKGKIRIELYRPGHSTLSDEKQYIIIEQPAPPESTGTTDFPEFEVIPVEGPGSENWEYICEGGAETDVSKHASGVEMNSGTLYVYYSEAFPRFANELKRFEQQDQTLAASFRARYEVWLAVHSLLLHQDEEQREQEVDEEVSEPLEREERCRMATMSSMVASQDVRNREAATATSDLET